MKYNEIEKNYYSDLEEYEKENEINYMLDNDEQIIYKGKPNKKGFIFNKIFRVSLIKILNTINNRHTINILKLL